MICNNVLLRAKFLFFLFLQFLGFGVGLTLTQAQDLLQSRQSSYYTYIFKLSNQEAEILYQNQPTSIAKSYFHTLVDSFPTDSDYTNKLPLGHYLETFSIQNQQVTTLFSIQNLQLHILNNEQDLLIQLVDTAGNIINDAKVSIGSKKIPFDPATQTYSKRKSNTDGLLVVNHQEMVSFFELTKSRNNPWVKRNGQKLLYKSPFQYIWKPIYFIAKVPVDSYQSIKYGNPRGSIYQTSRFFEKAYHRTACLFDDRHCNWWSDNRKYPKGYLVFNKPKYLPQDSVFFKAFITNHQGKPKQNQAKAYLIGGFEPIFLGELQAYQKGAFEYQFHLHDSLDLRLDKSYRIELRDAKDRSLINNRFYYEAYELNKIALQLQTTKQQHQQGENLCITITAKDDNGLLIKDSRIQAVISPNQPTSYHQSDLFIPDTLAVIEQNLLPDRPTQLTIDPKNFPAADFTYSIDVKLLTADNETREDQVQVTYKHFGDPFEWNMGMDSIIFKANTSFVNPIKLATLVGLDKFGNEVAVAEGELPLKTPIHAHFSHYRISSDQYSQTFSLSEETPLIQVYTERTPHQLQLLVRNPRQLSVNYHLFKKNKIIDSGYGTDLAIARKTSSRQNHYVNINYLWAGEMVKATYGVPLRKKKLTIQVDEPNIITPGQESTINLQVTDYKNNPVPDVDVTAFALTKKFNYSPPSVPSFEKSRSGKSFINSFNGQPKKLQQVTQRLDLRTWQVLAHIDSIEYYKFLFPHEQRYEYHAMDPDSITQFAPFLFINGQPQSAAIIYIDNVPVYFDWNSIQSPYSFPVNPGKHQVKIRTSDYLVTLNDLEFKKGFKTIFSIDLETYKGPLEKITMEKHLTEQEKRSLYPYIFPLKNIPTERFAYLKKGNQIHFLGIPGTQYGKRILSGPIAGTYTYQLLDGYSHTLLHEPGMEYEFQASVVKMREVKTAEFPRHLNASRHIFSLNDFAWSENRLEQLWERYLTEKRRQNIQYQYPYNNRDHKGRLIVAGISENSDEATPPITTVLRHKEDASKVWVFPSSSTVFSNLAPGFYEMTQFYQGMKYIYRDSVEVKNNGLNYLRLSVSSLKEKDEFSSNVAQTLEQYVFNKNLSISEEQKLVSELNRSYFSKYPYSGPGKMVSGYVFDHSDLQPLPGALIQIKGTNYGTATDINGYFSLTVPYTSHELIITFIGFSPEEVSVFKERNLNIYLKEDTQALKEIIITGYGGQERRQEAMSNAISYEEALVVPMDNSSSFYGSVQGIAVSPNQFIIRGTASKGQGVPPLIILNGSVFLGDISSISTNEISSMEWLESKEAIARFGQAGSNGAIILMTSEAVSVGIENDPSYLSEELWGESLKKKVSIRQNFSDAAFWQPKLRTDKDGKASFKIQFPDDITAWQSFYLAMGNQKRTGQTQGSIKAMLPLAAQLSVPRFLIQGDSSWVIGKTINYLPSPSEVTRSFSVDGLQQELPAISVAQIQLDSLLIVAKDSLSIEYSLQRAETSYEDGELREIPVFPKGLEKTKGHFALLENDTVVSIQKDPNLPFGTLYLHSDLQSILAEEISFVHTYKYDCNEQLASKLKALLAAKSLAKLKDESFQQDKEIERIIKQLEKTQGKNGFWGWWEHSTSNLWISQHVLEALFQAKEEGYSLNINQKVLEASLIWQLEYAEEWTEKLQIGNALLVMGATFDTQDWVNKLESSSKSTLMERIRLMELKSRLDIPFDLAELLQYERKSILGNSYFGAGEYGFNIVHNDIQYTILAYKIIQRLRPDEKRLLASTRNYLLEKRGSFGWTNTFESTQIIETLMQDLPTLTGESGSSMRLVSDSKNELLELSKKTTITDDGEIKLIKSGTSPIYYSYYERYWESNPIKSTGVFEIATTYNNGNQASWKAGEQIEIQVEVKVKEDASFVMINVPIPGSCSYAEKKSNNWVESHREYFPEQTAIFCEKLPKGNYTFSISLIPRFEGTYTLNPATIELMYFPSIQSNAEIKKVKIGVNE